MGGWVTLFGDVKNAESRIQEFRKAFAADNVPDLRIDDRTNGEDLRTIFWAWNNHEIPDMRMYSDEDGNVVIVCGVITDLGRFGSIDANDNEILKKIVGLWRQYGETFVNQINGSWSLLLLDAAKKTLIVYTDRFASRSVWIAKDDVTWFIGNFPSALAAMCRDSVKFSAAGLWSLFQTSRRIPGKGIFSNIYSLFSGQRAIIRLHSECTISNWWSRRYNPDKQLLPKDWGYILAQALCRSARHMKLSSDNIHLFLSGGLDSRIAAAAYCTGIDTVTLCSSPNTESRIAAVVSKQLKLKHRTIVRSPYWYSDTIKAAALIASGSYHITHAHFIVPVVRISNRLPRAAFSLGDLLENFNKHYFSVPQGTAFSFTPERLPSLLIECPPSTLKNGSRLSKIFRKDIGGRLQECWMEEVKKSASLVMDVSADDSDRFDTYLRWIDVAVTYTYNLITCIWPFASERTLLFDNELNDISLRIPSSVRGKGVLHYWILWFLNKWMVLLPNANSFLPLFAPNRLHTIATQVRPKLGSFRRHLYQRIEPGSAMLPTSGSWPLFNELYRRDPTYRSMIESLLTDNDAFPDTIFDSDGIHEVWNGFLHGDFGSFLIVNSLITFGALNRIFRCSGMSWD